MVAKMAKAFGVTVDFLIGEGENASYDKETVERINDIQKMDAETKSVLLNVIDTTSKISKLNRLSQNNQSPEFSGLCYY